MRKIECDCCGTDGAKSAFTIRYPTNGGKHQVTYDLCERCREMLDDFLRKAYNCRHGIGDRNHQEGGNNP